jgi:hypothetical protein
VEWTVRRQLSAWIGRYQEERAHCNADVCGLNV